MRRLRPARFTNGVQKRSRSKSAGVCAVDGAALIIDYGHAQHGLGDTLQAVVDHAFSEPLRAPGQSDLTAHVDFMALAQTAEITGARIHGPVSQRDFLRRLGIEKRAAALKARAQHDKGNEIEQALSRLTAVGPGGMVANYSRSLQLPIPSSGRCRALRPNDDDRGQRLLAQGYPPRLLYPAGWCFRRSVYQP